MILRRAELKDKNEIREIVNELYINVPQFVWNEDDFVTKQIQNNEYIVIQEAGRLAAVMSLRRRDDKINIETLVVRKEFQRKGFGSELIEFAKQFTKSSGFNKLHAYSFCEYRASDFYVKKGFNILPYAGYYKNRKYECFELLLG